MANGLEVASIFAADLAGGTQQEWTKFFITESRLEHQGLGMMGKWLKSC